MKRILAILLSLTLVICMFPAMTTTAWAAVVVLENSSVSLDRDSAEYTGSSVTPTVTVKDAKGADVTGQCTQKWTDKQGSEVTSIKDAGTYTLTVEGNGTDVTGKVTKTFVVKPVDFSRAKIEYTNSTLKENFKGEGGTAFDNVKIGATIVIPAGSVSVTGISAQFVADPVVTKKDANTVEIAVSPKKPDDNNNVIGSQRFIYVTVTDSLNGYKVVGTGTTADKDAIPDQTYNSGKELKPTVYVVPVNNAPGVRTGYLKEGVDYTVEYTNNTTGGYTATVTVTGKGKYSGIRTAEFNVIGKSIKNLSITSYNTLKGQEPTFDVKDGTTLLVKGTDYIISEYNSKSDKTGTATLQGITNYSETRDVTFTVISTDNQITRADVVCRNNLVTYTGNKQEMKVIVTVNGKQLTLGRDYSLAYYNEEGKKVDPINVGSYTVYIKGLGNYATVNASERGMALTDTLLITSIDTGAVKVDFTSSTIIDGANRVPKVKLTSKYSGTVIPETDYNVYYYNFNGKYGTPWVQIAPVNKGEKAKNQDKVSTGSLTGKNITADYKGTTINQTTNRNVSVSVDRAYYKTTSGSDARVTILNNSINYIAERIYLDISAYDGTYRRTLTDSDYTVTIKDSANKTVSYLYGTGTYTVVVESSAYYESRYDQSFKVEKTIKIVGVDISGYVVTLNKTSENATGGRISLPLVTSVAKGTDKLYSRDYSVYYLDQEGKKITSISQPGTYKVVVEGKGGYSGTTYATFTVVGKSQSITGVASSYKAYPGGEVIQLYPKATEGRFTYTSSDSTVATVSASGLVTPLKAGRAKITIKTTGTTTYDPATYSTVIKVYPKKAVMTKKPWNYGKKGQVKVRWYKQDNITRYEIRYSRAKNFAKGTYITKKVNAAQNDFTTQSTTLKNLKSGQRYYVKVRAVKEVYNDYGKKLTYYGAWSGWKSVVVK